LKSSNPFPGTLIDILSTIVSKLEGTVFINTSSILTDLLSEQNLFFYLFTLFLVLTMGAVLIPYIIISEKQVSYLLTISQPLTFSFGT
jgi:hypothetical protein